MFVTLLGLTACNNNADNSRIKEQVVIKPVTVDTTSQLVSPVNSAAGAKADSALAAKIDSALKN